MAKRGRPKIETKEITRKRIAEARDSKGFSNMELSRQLGVDSSAIRKWINGNLSVPEYHLEKIASVCEVPIEWLKGTTLPDIINDSEMILNNFNPETAENKALEISKQAEAETLTIIYALEMCGYSFSDIKDKAQFSAYMTDTIKNIVETYMDKLN